MISDLNKDCSVCQPRHFATELTLTLRRRHFDEVLAQFILAVSNCLTGFDTLFYYCHDSLLSILLIFFLMFSAYTYTVYPYTMKQFNCTFVFVDINVLIIWLINK